MAILQHSLQNVYDFVINVILTVPFIFWAWALLRIPLYKRRIPAGYILARYWFDRRPRLQHRIFAERALRRSLRDEEVVHHRNLIKDDNRLRNLCVMERREHWRFHRWLRWYQCRSGRLPDAGIEERILVERYGAHLLGKK